MLGGSQLRCVGPFAQPSLGTWTQHAPSTPPKKPNNTTKKTRHRPTNIQPPPKKTNQVLRYMDGQKYDAHWDYFDHPGHWVNQTKENRVATVLLYLGEVLEGGETSLPIAEPIDPVRQVGASCVWGGGVRCVLCAACAVRARARLCGCLLRAWDAAAATQPRLCSCSSQRTHPHLNTHLALSTNKVDRQAEQVRAARHARRRAAQGRRAAVLGHAPRRRERRPRVAARELPDAARHKVDGDQVDPQPGVWWV